MRAVSLFISLFLFWLVLSGQSKPFLIGAGVVSSLICVWVAHRMDVADSEGHPHQLFASTLTFYPWLVWEIFKAGWSVTKVIINPALPISPTVTRVVATQRTTAGLVTYANSITLTPGTITTAIDGNILTIHAIVADGATDLEGGGMDARVTQFEKGL